MTRHVFNTTILTSKNSEWLNTPQKQWYLLLMHDVNWAASLTRPLHPHYVVWPKLHFHPSYQLSALLQISNASFDHTQSALNLSTLRLHIWPHTSLLPALMSYYMLTLLLHSSCHLPQPNPNWRNCRKLCSLNQPAAFWPVRTAHMHWSNLDTIRVYHCYLK